MRLLMILPAALVGFLVGCNKTNEGGTPGTNASFTLDLPTAAAMAKPIKQGTSDSFDATVDRKGDFKKDVKIKVEGPDKLKVKVEPGEIKASSGETKFRIHVEAEKDAPVGEHEIKVTGTPDGGGTPTTGSFKVKVTAP